MRITFLHQTYSCCNWRMRSTAVVHLLCLISLVSGVALLCIASSIFDFIVCNQMYYTVPDQQVLLDSDLAYWFFGSTLLSIILTLSVLGCESFPDPMMRLALKYPTIFSILHSIALSIGSILSAFCVYMSVIASNEVGRFAFNATPRQFQLASYWYFVRLRACVFLFGMESVILFSVLCILYLGIQCRYRTFAQLPQNNNGLGQGQNLIKQHFFVREI